MSATTLLSLSAAAALFSQLDLSVVDPAVRQDLEAIQKATNNFTHEQAYELEAENFASLAEMAQQDMRKPGAELLPSPKKKADKPAGKEPKPAPATKASNGGGKKPPTSFDNGKSLEECEELVREAESAARQARQLARLNDYKAERIKGGMSQADADQLTVEDLPKPTVARKVKDGVRLLLEKVVDNKVTKVAGLSNDSRAALKEFEEQELKDESERVARYVRERGEVAAERIMDKARELKKTQAA